MKNRTAVIALGGNAILQPRQRGSFTEQRANIRLACAQIAGVIAAGWRVVVTHGNGPQVGNILLQNEEARAIVPPAPLDVCGAQTQGMLGYLLQQELQRVTGLPAVSLVTQVLVDQQDPAFASPTKPVGPFYTDAQARLLMAQQQGWAMQEDAGRGWRRLVPSPRPLRVVEAGAVQALMEAGFLVIASGGGGVPVCETPEGLAGVEAVIDKDLAATVLGAGVGASLLLILTDVPRACLNYGRPDQQPLGAMTVAEAERYLGEGHFKAGSMQAKVEGAARFVAGGGDRAVIAALGEAVAALRGDAGTHVVP